jgi:hypothetical protein
MVLFYSKCLISKQPRTPGNSCNFAHEHNEVCIFDPLTPIFLILPFAPSHTTRLIRVPAHQRYFTGDLQFHLHLVSELKILLYLIYRNEGSTGVCAKRCGLYVCNSNCDLWGWEMTAAFDQLRDRGCRICGVKTMMAVNSRYQFHHSTSCGIVADASLLYRWMW